MQTSLDVEDADLAPLDRHDLARAGRQLARRADNVAAHARRYNASALSLNTFCRCASVIGNLNEKLGLS